MLSSAHATSQTIPQPPPQDTGSTMTSIPEALVSCPCDPAAVTSSETRPWWPARKGHIGCTHAPFLSAFLTFLPNGLSDGPPDSRLAATGESSVQTPQHSRVEGANEWGWGYIPESPVPTLTRAGGLVTGRPKGPRPCIIWQRAPKKKGIAKVFLMGTFSKTPAHRLPLAVKDYFVVVYTPMSASEDAPAWDLLPHIHSSPCWASSATQYLIPLLVPVHTEDLKPYYNKGLDQNMYDARDYGDDAGNCAYINEESLCELTRLHRIIRARQSLLLSRGPSAQEAVQDFLREIGPRFDPAAGSIPTASNVSTASMQDNCPESMRSGPSIPSTEGQLKPPRAPARTVQPNVSYSSIAKRATQSGASAHSTASTRPKPDRQATIRPERPATVKAERQTTVERERQETIRPERRQGKETTPVGEMKGKSTKAEGGQMAPAPSVKHRAPSVKSNASSAKSVRSLLDTSRKKAFDIARIGKRRASNTILPTVYCPSSQYYAVHPVLLANELEVSPPAEPLLRPGPQEHSLYDIPLNLNKLHLKSSLLQRGCIRRIEAHLLASLTGLITEEELAAHLKQHPNSRTPFLSRTRKNPRPCIVWNSHDGLDDMVDVFLMGTFEGTKDFHLLSPALRHWVITVYEHSHRKDRDTLTHAHASPTSNTDPTWLIPLVVTVPAGSLQEHGQAGHRAYIDQQTQDVLAIFHRQMQKEFEFISQFDTIRELFSRILLADTRITRLGAYLTMPQKRVMQKDSPLYDQPSSFTGYSSGQFSVSTSSVASASEPVPAERGYGAGRGGSRASGRGGGSVSSQRDTSRSCSRGTYHQSASGRSTPSLSRRSTGLKSQSSFDSHDSRFSHGRHSHDYFTATSGISGSGTRTRNASGASNESGFWRSSGGWDIARERRESGALERRASSVRVEKRKHSPTTPTAPRAMPEVRPPTQPFPELPSLALPRPEALRLALPETPRKPIAQPQQPFAPPETPQKTRAPADSAGLLASLKKLSPPSLKNFGRRRSKENAETPTRERGDPLSPKEPSLRRSSRANSLHSSSRPNSTPSSPKTGKKASALMSPLNKVAHLLRVGGGRPASRAPSEDGRD
ncbi:hypothetical protein EV715DRAFT_277019 [Schizophyllum commune]